MGGWAMEDLRYSPETLVFGADYNPDQWSKETWQEDIRLMKVAHVNLVTLPVFGWAQIEPREGFFEFDWLDEILELLHKNGINFNLATATATPPAWLVRKFPEILPVDFNGVRLEYGSRQSYCPSSPIFKEYTRKLASKMAERYGRHPGLKFWHISNEYGDHVSRCYCPSSSSDFRDWLSAKYATVDAINQAWETKVWGQRYSHMDEIEPPRRSMGPNNPSQLLDFERFSSDAMIELFLAEREVLRSITPNIPVTTNFMSICREIDYAKLASLEDLVTDDAYPDPSDPRHHIIASLNYSMMRSLKKDRPWLLLEQAPSAVSWRNVNVPKAPGQMRLMSYHALAHGSDGVMFFQWRQARSGTERFHSSMLGHTGEDSRIFREVSALGEELSQVGEIVGSLVKSKIGFLVDWDSRWAMRAEESLPSLAYDYMTQLLSWYEALFDINAQVDCVFVTEEFDKYETIFVPTLMMCDVATSRKLEKFVASGGKLVVGPFSGVVDANNGIHPGGGIFQNLLKATVEEPWPLASGENQKISIGEKTYLANTWTELLTSDADEVIAEYASGPLVGNPAVTLSNFGDGAAVYISCVLEKSALQSIFSTVLRVPSTPEHFAEFVTRSNANFDYEFVLNHSPEIVSLRVNRGFDILANREIAGGLRDLSGYGVIILKRARESASERQ
jgi:beta-galactosidase